MTILAQRHGRRFGDHFNSSLAGTLICCWLLACPMIGIAAPPQKKSPPLVSVVTVKTHEYHAPQEYIGHVEAVRKVALRARVSGVLEQVNFREGNSVPKDQLLYLIEPAPYQARLEAAQAEADKTLASVKRAERYLKRVRAAIPGSVSASAIETAEADHLEALASHAAARAAVKLAELEFRYTRVSAPLSGRIGPTAFTEGNLIGPDSGTLAQIVQLSPIRVRYAISENDQATVKTIRAALSSKQDATFKLQIRLPNGTLLEDQARIDFIDNNIDPNTGTLNVWALVENDAETLLPGQYVTVRIDRTMPQSVPLVPQAAVLEDQEGRYVLCVDASNNVEKRRISTSGTVGSMWVAESGLQSGDRVVVEGLQKIKPGQAVKTTERDGEL